MNRLNKIGAFYNKFEEVLLASMLGVSVVLIFAQVVGRKMFNNSISWSEEVTRYLFIWMIWLGTSFAQKDNDHIYVELFCNRVKGNARYILDIVIKLIWLSACIFFAVNGTQVVAGMMRRGKMATSLPWLPLWIVYFSLPFSQAALGVRVIVGIVADIVNMRRGVPFSANEAVQETVQEKEG